MDDFAVKHSFFALLLGGPRASAGSTDSASLDVEILREWRRDVERAERAYSLVDALERAR